MDTAGIWEAKIYFWIVCFNTLGANCIYPVKAFKYMCGEYLQSVNEIIRLEKLLYGTSMWYMCMLMKESESWENFFCSLEVNGVSWLNLSDCLQLCFGEYFRWF